MKSFVFLIGCTLLFSACKDSKSQATAPLEKMASFEKLNNLEWVLGNWSNINENTQSFEVWERESDSVFIAMSVTLQEGDTIFAESMRLYQIDNRLHLYIETVGADANPVTFTQIENAQYPFTFENQANEFPSQITYSQPSKDKIHAWVSGTIDGAPQTSDFYFNKTN